MGAFTDMLLPDKGSGGEREKDEQTDEGDPLPGTARHREFYPEGVADILKVGFFGKLCSLSNLFVEFCIVEQYTIYDYSFGKKFFESAL